MSKSSLPKSPIFIPKVQDSKIMELGLELPAIMVDAHITEWRKSAITKLKADLFIINPVTHHLLFKDAKDGKNFKKLGYPDVTAEKLYSDPIFRKDKIIKHCIDSQINKGASIIIAPYLFAEDTDDTKFGLNISMLAESIQYLEENKIELPIYAMIYLGSPVLTRPAIVNFIIDRYREDYNDKVAGYFIAINDLDDRKASEDALRGLAYMAFQLSKDRNVFVNSIGAFGEVLSAIGATGFISGLGGGETSSVKLLQDKPGKFKNVRALEWTYIPEILDYANDGEVKKIGYKCSCPECKNSTPTDGPSKKRHFLFRRMELMNALSLMSRAERISFTKDRIEQAHKLASSYVRKYRSPFKTIHLDIWLRVLEDAKLWTYDSESDDLDELLKELEK